MSKHLTLLMMRHALTRTALHVEQDKSRMLTQQGKADCQVMASWLQVNQFCPDLILCSAVLRTKQTLDGLQTCYPALQSAHIAFMEEIYHAGVNDLLKILVKHGKTNNKADGEEKPHNMIMVLGHFPTVQEFSLGLCKPQAASQDWQALQTHYPTSAITVIRPNVTNWNEILLDGSADLQYFVTPQNAPQNASS